MTTTSKQGIRTGTTKLKYSQLVTSEPVAYFAFSPTAPVAFYRDGMSHERRPQFTWP